MDPQTGKTETVESDPLGKVDFGGALFSEATDELVETWYIAARAKTYYKEKAFGDDVHWIERKFQYPKNEVMVVSRTRDESFWLVNIVSATEPGQTYLFNRKTRTLTPQFKIREKLPREYLTEMKPVSYKSSDGLEIPAYLVLPKGVAAKNLPTLALRRTLGTRRLGLQYTSPILRKPWLRGADAELSRFHWLRQEISRRRQS